MAFEKEPHCSFCGKKRSEVDQLIEGTEGFICNDCIDESYALINGQEEPLIDEVQDEKKFFDNVPTPHEMTAHLNDALKFQPIKFYHYPLGQLTRYYFYLTQRHSLLHGC